METNPLGPTARRMAAHRLSRRTALAAGAGSITATMLGRVGGEPAARAQATPPTASPGAGAGNNLPPNVPAWMRTPGAPPAAYGERAAAEAGVVRIAANPTTTLAPLAHLDGTLTPNALFFEVSFGGIPAIDPSQHRLLVHGLVERPTLFTMDDLRRFPAVSVVHFLECAGNSSSEWTAATQAPTVQRSHGRTSSAEWTGAPVAAILREVGLKPGGTWLLAEGADAAALNRSIPVAKAMADALLVYAANGEALHPAQGFPVRLLLPGFEGNMNVKWLRRLKVGDRPWQTRYETSRYTDLLPDGLARQFTFVMEAKSVITFPSGGHRLAGPGYVEITGLAWSGRGKITQVDVSTDGGQTWQEATLQEPVLPMAWTRFRLPWRWDGQATRVQSRAIDETGYVQPTRAQLVAARGVNSFNHFNGMTTWAIAADGTVRNVDA